MLFRQRTLNYVYENLDIFSFCEHLFVNGSNCRTERLCQEEIESMYSFHDIKSEDLINYQHLSAFKKYQTCTGATNFNTNNVITEEEQLLNSEFVQYSRSIGNGDTFFHGCILPESFIIDVNTEHTFQYFLSCSLAPHICFHALGKQALRKQQKANQSEKIKISGAILSLTPTRNIKALSCILGKDESEKNDIANEYELLLPKNTTIKIKNFSEAFTNLGWQNTKDMPDIELYIIQADIL